MDIDNFKFYRNSKVIKSIEDIGLKEISMTYYKELGLTKKSKSTKKNYIEYNNINIDILLDKLEDEKFQKKIIKCITNYKKIPQKTINYFKNIKPLFSKNNISDDKNKISDDNIKQFIIDYLRIKYNELSIFDIDIYFIYFEGWKNNCLDEEGPKDYIIDRIRKFNKDTKCVIM
jgi:hypothetical protein